MLSIANYVWDVDTLSWVPETQGSGGGSSTPAPQTGITPATASVTATSSTAVAANADRVRASITNWGASDVCLAYGATAVFGRGEYLIAGGGSTNVYTTQAITAICNTALTSTLAIQEWE
jgi:hypothetical protein